jgi:hypothetical protein
MDCRGISRCKKFSANPMNPHMSFPRRRESRVVRKSRDLHAFAGTRGWRRGAYFFMFVCALATTGCSLPQSNFSQYPGFAEYYTAHPPRNMLPSTEEQALLDRYKPRFFLLPGHAGLIDFYQDYIAQGSLIAADGKLISASVTREILNANKEKPGVVFQHHPTTQPAQATIFGRIDYEELAVDREKISFTFLTYQAVFRHSGLAAGFAGWRASLVSWFADLNDWHQLDHYTAATIVLNESKRPVALMLQQHNYHHTYVFDCEFPFPQDGRVRVDIAIRSNELYPNSPERVRHRAVRFNSPAEMRYLLGFGDKPRIAEDDITEGRNEAEYRLELLPPSDAFYTFKGFLGERRRLPGRDGPPGADFNALPETKALTAQMLMGFWREGNRDDLNRLESTYTKTGKQIDFVRAQARIYRDAVRVKK